MTSDRPSLDTDVAAVAEDLTDQGVPGWHTMSVSAARRIEDEVFSSQTDLPVGAVRELGFNGPDGEVPVRLYRPEETPSPILVFYHGGGWVLGTLDSADDICRRLCRRAGAVVVSVDYRLAPEHRFPAGLMDCLSALEWVRNHDAELGGDGRIGVVGSSAGGNLAAAVGIRDGSDGGSDLTVQVLLYPVTSTDLTTDSYATNADAVLLTRADMAWFWEMYLRSEIDAANPYAAPLKASRERLARGPPAVIATAGYDPLRDDGRQYAAALRKAGVEAELMDYPQMAHGFLSLVEDVPAADDAFDEVADAIRVRLNE